MEKELIRNKKSCFPKQSPFTSLFPGDKYWRYDDEVGRVELDYPRDISMWRGVPSDIDAAFQYTDGKTYFFKGKEFWQFDDNAMEVVSNPKKIGTHWMQCAKEIRNPFETNSHDQMNTASEDKSIHGSALRFLSLFLLLFYSFMI